MSDNNNRKAPPSAWRPPKLKKNLYSSTTLIPRASDYDEEPPEVNNRNDVRLEMSDGNDLENSSETTALLANVKVSRISPNLIATDPSQLNNHQRGKDYHVPSSPKAVAKLKNRRSNGGTGARKEIESIKLADEIRGALIFHIPANCCCKDYTVRIYLHYWIWQIPVLITNIILFCIWNTTHNNPNPSIALTEVGFLAVGPVFLSALVRDKIFLWGVYWSVKKSMYLGCTKYGMFNIKKVQGYK